MKCFTHNFVKNQLEQALSKTASETFISIMFDFSAMNISMTTQWFAASLLLHEFIKGNWYLSSTIPTLKGLIL